MKHSVLDWIVMVLVIVGAVNWGLVGALNFNLVSTLFGSVAWLEMLVYVLVGLSGLYMIYMVSKK